jgi:Domain of unknown function (DUF4412)
MHKTKTFRFLSAALAVVLALIFVQPSEAGIYYEAKTTVDQGAGSSLVHAWVDGENARIELIESDNPLTKKNSYFITRDAGKTLYIVNPEDKTYSEFDLAAMINLAEGMSSLVNLEFSDPEIEKLDEKDGGSILGHSTRYYKYRTQYDFQMKMMGIKRSTFTETIQEMWTTTDLDQPALGVWLRKEGRSAGDSSLDRLIAAEMEKVQGFPLKTVAVSTSISGKKGKKTTTKSTTEVLVIREEAIEASRFEIPADYERVELFPAGEGEEGGSNPFKGIFGGSR